MLVCFVSNGVGEDRSAAVLAARLVSDFPAATVIGAALLSDGDEYRRRALRVAVGGSMPWSGGFSTVTPSAFIRDLPSFNRLLHFRRSLTALRSGTDAVVVVGDVFLLMLAKSALRKPTFFVALAKSNHHTPHSLVERAILRQLDIDVITRDSETCQALQASGIRAHYFGNLLMDGLQPLRPSQEPPSVVLLPGSRREAPLNFVRMLAVVEGVDCPARWSCALAPTVPVARIAEHAQRAGWTLDGRRLVRERYSITLVENDFEAALAGAELVLGMAGTANEQAAGLGCVVVSFPGAGPQAHPRRLREQEALLGGGAIFEESIETAIGTVNRLLRDPAERHRRGLAGRSRMGSPGAAAISAFLGHQMGLPDGRRSESASRPSGG